MSGLHPHHKDAEGTLGRMIIGSEQENSGFNQPMSPTYIPISGSQRMQHEAVESYIDSKIELRDIRIEDYSFWVAQNWKERHLSFPAKERITKGLREETREVIEAANDLQRDPKSLEKRDSLISELGDYLWNITAAALLLRVDTQRALAHYMLDENGEANITSVIREVDEYFLDGNKPRSTKNLYNEEDTFSELGPQRALPQITEYLRAGLNFRYGYAEEEFFGPIAPGVDDRTYGEDGYAKGVFFVAYYAHELANSSLEKVIGRNIEKLSIRVERGKIDKEDGERTKDEL